jgi:hypothetical protein
VAVLKPAEALGMGGAADLFWHEHIIDTRGYQLFCDVVCGRFMHHTPQDDAKSSDGSGLIRTLELIDKYFGPPSRNVWPVALAGECQNCAMCDKIGSDEVSPREGVLGG